MIISGLKLTPEPVCPTFPATSFFVDHGILHHHSYHVVLVLRSILIEKRDNLRKDLHDELYCLLVID
jgi:hypothetical protein